MTAGFQIANASITDKATNIKNTGDTEFPAPAPTESGTPEVSVEMPAVGPPVVVDVPTQEAAPAPVQEATPAPAPVQEVASAPAPAPVQEAAPAPAPVPDTNTGASGY